MDIRLNLYNENKELLKEIQYQTLSEMYTEVMNLNRYPNWGGDFLAKNESFFFRVLIDELVLLEAGIDDLIYEFNLDTLRASLPLQEFLQTYYPEYNVKLLADIKSNYSDYVINTLGSFIIQPEVGHKIKGIEKLCIGDNEVYYHDETSTVLPGYEYRVFSSNLDRDFLLIALLPEYGSTKYRYNFRNVNEITDYSISLCNFDGKYSNDLAFFVSYEKHHPNYKQYKDT